MESGIRRLAVEVEDHPLEYGLFEGTIPEGEYGAGKVSIWDRGSYTLKEKDSNHLRFALHGNKLKGGYELRFFKEERGRRHWLLFKTRE